MKRTKYKKLDSNELAAVGYAKTKVAGGVDYGLAIWQASQETGVPVSVIAKELGYRGGSKKKL